MFADIVNRPEADIDLTRAAAMIGLRQYPDLDLDSVSRSLDDMAVGVRDLPGLRTRLFADLGFAGESLAYYHPDNSFLHRVVERWESRSFPTTIEPAWSQRECSRGVAIIGPSQRGANADQARP